MSRGKDVAENCLSIDESDTNCPSLDSSKLQRNWMQLPQQLTQNLLAGRQLFGNSVLPAFPCSNSDMSHQALRDTSVPDQMKRNTGSCLPNFDELGLNDCLSGTVSLLEKVAGEGRIETNTSEYYSAENGESASGNCEDVIAEKNSVVKCEEAESVEQHKGTRRRSSSGSRSSPEEEIQTKRASLLKSKERYTSIEYDPSRRDSIPVLAHGDSVFSEDIPPQPRRKCSRERLVKQRSQSTSDLPDLIQSSPSPPPKSPDVVPHFDAFKKRVRSEESLVKSYRDPDLEFINETFERKQEIEGTVHDGIANNHNLKRSVSFQESPTVYSISSQDKPDGEEYDSDQMTPVSPRGEEGRQHFRALKDSGYRTGSSSKGSLQSQLSDQTNGSDSVLTDNSVEKDDEDMDTLTDPGTVGGMPLLSIFESNPSMHIQKQSVGTSVMSKSLYMDGLGDSQNSGAGNMPNLSIFKTTSDGSLCLKSGEFSSSLDATNARVVEELMPSDLSGTDNSHVEAHDKFADEVLEKRMEGRAAGSSVLHSRTEGFQKNSLPREKGLSQQPSRELFEHYISKIQIEDPEALSDLLAQLDNLHFASDSSTPSPSPHDNKQSRILASIIELSLTPTEKKDSTYCTAPERDEVIVNDKLNMLKEWLERTSRCQDNSCIDPDCKKAKALLQGFNVSVQSNSPLDKDQESVLVALRCHSERCEDIKCPVPYCALLCQIDPWDRSEALCQIRQKLDIILDLTDTQLKNGRFLALSPDCQHGGPMRENEQWMALSPLGNSRSVTLISDLAFSSLQLYVLKMVPLLEENHQWRVYEQLRELKHPHLVQHMWIMEHGRDLLICTQFMSDGSLRHRLQESMPNLPWKMVVSYMQQIISGVMALHGMGIVYINWTSCNILLDNAGRVAKVSNLSMSVKLGQQNVDYGGIKNALPPAILPPELLVSNPSVYPVSDSWGCGCLLYELLLGRKVWYQYRHETKDYIWRQLQGRVPPIPRELVQWPEVFQACWQYDFRQRHPLTNLAILLR